MKKINTVLTSLTLLTAAASMSYASTAAKSGIKIQGQASYNMTPDNIFNQSSNDIVTIPEVTSTETTNGGYGGGVFVGYEYAFHSNMTLGGKLGYQYVYDINSLNITTTDGSDNVKLNVHNIPLLATFSYYFNSGWLISTEAGIDLQKWQIKEHADSYGSSTTSSNWNIAPMLGVSSGYQWQNGLSLTASYSYVFGKSTDDLGSVGTNKALAFSSIGINLSYIIPM
ncbi:MAG: hypothetical protein EP298_10970 [Gammaproteobacteria bacterium]|nr:MAG: hypothetical protein EP298_10970 [Gammaproteobacteria bacterium]UTW41602.1 outer membrane beta-barrel protein [bacterium SCSIO 12844]